MTKAAKLRVCASCSWFFKLTPDTAQTGCPKCGFAHYGARYAYGKQAYQLAVTQQPWIDFQTSKLHNEVRKTSEFKPRKHRRKLDFYQQAAQIRAEIGGYL